MTIHAIPVAKEDTTHLGGTARWGDLLRYERTRRGLSCAALAERCGVSARCEAAWEEGESWPLGREAQKLYASVAAMRGHATLLAVERDKARGPILHMAGPILRQTEPPPAHPPTIPSPAQAQESAAPVSVRDPEAATAAIDTSRFQGLSMRVLGEHLRGWRRSEGLTGTDLSELLGVDRSLLYRWERGDERLPRKHLAKVLALLPRLLSEPPVSMREVSPRGRKSSASAGGPDRQDEIPSTSRAVLEILIRAHPVPTDAGDIDAWASRMADTALRVGGEFDRRLKKSS